MLVLTRKSGQSIRISNNVVVTILESNAGQVKIGVSAPNEIPIHREEIYKRIQEENRSAIISGEIQKGVLSDLLKGI